MLNGAFTGAIFSGILNAPTCSLKGTEAGSRVAFCAIVDRHKKTGNIIEMVKLTDFLTLICMFKIDGFNE
jgi:hypothetical protein